MTPPVQSYPAIEAVPAYVSWNGTGPTYIGP